MFASSNLKLQIVITWLMSDGASFNRNQMSLAHWSGYIQKLNASKLQKRICWFGLVRSDPSDEIRSLSDDPVGKCTFNNPSDCTRTLLLRCRCLILFGGGSWSEVSFLNFVGLKIVYKILQMGPKLQWVYLQEDNILFIFLARKA
jgi:hypothetical protein